MALCPPAMKYSPTYFFSRYPLEKNKLWNLTNLLTPMSWFAYFITILFVVISLKLSCYVGRKLGLKTISEEIALVPFRYLARYTYTSCIGTWFLIFRISVPEHYHQNVTLLFPRGFSGNMIYNVWTLFGGIMM